jgi:hypothetical protein
MNIIKNIDDVRKRIVVDEDEALGQTIQNQSIEAAIKGMRDSNGTVTKEWKDLMRNYGAEGSVELGRLCGEDADFMNSKWGKLCLVYILGDSGCGPQTTITTGARRSLTLRDEMSLGIEMRDNLDAEGEKLAKFL